MWLLSTSRAELHEFPSPEAVPGGYAILSHVWEEKEQTFQVTQWLRQICDKTGANPRDSSYPKIRHACILAQSHGYEWLWVDTSCIDKSSSADLSEAINSMYRYYSIASICYAYLRDVPPDPKLSQSRYYITGKIRFKFAESNWHMRGWTLQELIAPTFVLFLAHDWTSLGTKAELADLLQSVTGIPASLLSLDTRLADYSVAQRMSWAASRKTTRTEDRAYSLLGIFGINMPTLYGEGEQAFYRLQEEIMKRLADTTLFAWRSGHPYDHSVPFGIRGLADEHKYLLASSPEHFRGCDNIFFTPPAITAQNTQGSAKGRANSEHSGTITFSITPYGVLAHVPLIEHWYEDSSGGDEVTAYLFWSDHESGRPMGLRLKPCPTSADPFRPHYDVVEGRWAHGLSRDRQGRLLAYSRGSIPQYVRLTWQEIYITHRPPPDSIVSEHAGKVFVAMNLGSSTPFRISDGDVNALPFSPVPIELTGCRALSLPWDGDPPVILQFRVLRSPIRFYAMLHLGRCYERTDRTDDSDLGHWAFLRIATKAREASIPGRARGHELLHDCDQDHIHQWPDKTKSFPVVRKTTIDGVVDSTTMANGWIVLRFDPCLLNPRNTLIMRITTRFDERPATRPPSPLLLDLMHPTPEIPVPGGRTQSQDTVVDMSTSAVSLRQSRGTSRDQCLPSNVLPNSSPMNHSPPSSEFDPDESFGGYSTAEESAEEDCDDTEDGSMDEDYHTADDFSDSESESNPEDYHTADDSTDEDYHTADDSIDEDYHTEDNLVQDYDEDDLDWRGDERQTFPA